MKYLKLGRTGLEVSELCLGGMTFGDPARGDHSWTLDEERSRPIIQKALEMGINFLDTANAYSEGTSEELVGRAIKDYSRREDVVIATKVFNRMRPGPNGAGLSRRAIMTEVENSLRRLNTDYIDLYQIHRWDHGTPIEETLEALHDIVKSGKARYIGASSMYAWQFSKAIYTSRLNGWTEFVSMQNHLNLLNREEEREMLPLCRDQRIAVMPWSPLARGKLTRDWDEKTARNESDKVSANLYQATTTTADRAVVEAVAHVARSRGIPRAQIALAWVRQKAGVTAPIVGVSKTHHLDDAVASLDVELSAEEIRLLEDPYVPHGIVGFA